MAATRLRRGDREPVQAVARDEAYVYLLIMSLVAMIVGCVFLALDYDGFTGEKAPTVQVAVPERTATPPANPPVPPPADKPGGGEKPGEKSQ